MEARTSELGAAPGRAASRAACVHAPIGVGCSWVEACRVAVGENISDRSPRNGGAGQPRERAGPVGGAVDVFEAADVEEDLSAGESNGASQGFRRREEELGAAGDGGAQGEDAGPILDVAGDRGAGPQVEGVDGRRVDGLGAGDGRSGVEALPATRGDAAERQEIGEGLRGLASR